MQVGRLATSRGAEVSIQYASGGVGALVPGEIDAYIVSTESGFSPLGSSIRFLSAELDIPAQEISQLADWNRFENARVTLVGLPSRRVGSPLRGMILAPAESSECYKRFATPRFGLPFRDFYYNVAYEAISYAAGSWSAKRLAISHLSGCGRFHENIATCIAEALAHLCDEADRSVESITFLGDGEVSVDHLAGIRRLNSDRNMGGHRPISVETEQREGATLLHLDWGRHVEA